MPFRIEWKSYYDPKWFCSISDSGLGFVCLTKEEAEAVYEYLKKELKKR